MYFSHFSNTSITSIFFSGVIAFIIPFLFERNKWVKTCSLAVIISMVIFVIYLNGRAGWIGVLLAGVYIVWTKGVFDGSKVLYKALLYLGTVIFFLGVAFLLKPHSSQGRIHIYEITLQIIKKNWLSGIGIGKFKSVFNEYQADYFENKDIDSHQAILADNTFYAFNDYLQWTAETGIFGFLLLITVLIGFFRIHKLIGKRTTKPIIISAFSTLICIAITSMFSYPLQVVAIQLLVAICTGILIFYMIDKKLDNSRIKKVIRVSFAFGSCVIVTYFIIKTVSEHKQRQAEKQAFYLALSGFRNEAVYYYQTLSKNYPKSSYIQLLYAEQLYLTGRISEAKVNLYESMEYYVSDKTYRLKGQIEEEEGHWPDAERSYMRAIYMVPNRMINRFNLMNYYMRIGDYQHAKIWAKSILDMPVKVLSLGTESMLNQTKNILGKIR